MSMELELVLCVCSREVAEKIAYAVVEKRLAACADIIPGMWGLYSWKDEPQVEGEVTVLVTTIEDLSEDVYETILELHSADLPVIVSFDIQETFSSYIEWIATQLGAEF